MFIQSFDLTLNGLRKWAVMLKYQNFNFILVSYDTRQVDFLAYVRLTYQQKNKIKNSDKKRGDISSQNDICK